MLKITKKRDLLYLYNLDVVLIYVIVSLFYLQRIGFSNPQIKDALILLGANTSGVLLIYLHNKIYDKKEDEINQSSYKEEHFTLIQSLIVLLFFYSAISYLFLNNFLLYISGITLFLLGISYSHPTLGRLKKRFILKNLIPALCWSLSFFAMIHIGFPTIPPLEIIKIIFPIFIFTFLFEILWDIPDRKGDLLSGVQTLPVVVGLRSTKLILLFSLAIFFFLIENKIHQLISFYLGLFIIYAEETKQSYHNFLILLIFLVIILNLIFPPQQ
jgi:4-hydroxybenzoate polyprenyltransferase